MTLGFYLLVILTLFFYSFSQIDPNLTLIQSGWFLSFQKFMSILGYFDRPLSTSVFIVLTIALSIYPFLLVSKDKIQIKKKEIFVVIFVFFLLGMFSYPLFSHDIFNYIFDARVFVFHGSNPYVSTALMFPEDTWTRFMHWTHRTYPYGPAFLPISIIFYIFGLGKFITTLISFKLLMTLAYLGSFLLLLKNSGVKNSLVYALNPLIIYEVLIAGHLDIIMLFFALVSYFSMIRINKFKSYVFLLLSVATKYATILFLPIYYSRIFKNKEKWLVVMAYTGALLQIYGHDVLPHYFVVPMGITAISNNRKYWLFGLLVSVALLMIRYIPFLLTGNWPSYSLNFK